MQFVFLQMCFMVLLFFFRWEQILCLWSWIHPISLHQRQLHLPQREAVPYYSQNRINLEKCTNWKLVFVISVNNQQCVFQCNDERSTFSAVYFIIQQSIGCICFAKQWNNLYPGGLVQTNINCCLLYIMYLQS